MNNAFTVKTRTSKALLAIFTFAAGLCVATSANATLTTSSQVGGAANGSIRENFDNLNLGSSTQVTSTGITVSFTPDGGVVNGSSSGLYAAPYLTGNNGVGFGNSTGPDTTNYLTAGGRQSSSATLSWNSLQQYFGILWGSVDSYNTLTFYNGTTMVGQLTGSQVNHPASGSQGPDGTIYLNVDSTLGFDSVVMTSTQHAFEFDNVAFSSTPLDLPEPGALGMMGLGLLAIAGLAFRRRKLAVK